MKLTVHEIAALVQGSVVGDGTRIIKGVAGLEDASDSDLSFLRDGIKASGLKKFQSTSAGAVIVPVGVKDNGRTVVQVKNPIAAFSKILAIVEEEGRKPAAGVHPLAAISPKAKIGRNCEIGPFCIVEEGAQVGDNVRLVGSVYIGTGSNIGKNTLIYPQVVIRENISIGENCIIHAGAVIGSDGFGFYHANGKNTKIPQIGSVLIEDDVEIGSCTTIDRGTIGATIIRKGTKIDNLVQIAHNVEIGSSALIAAQCGVAGSSTIGKGVMMGGQSGVSDHVTVGAGTQVAGKTGVMQNAPPKSILFGVPAQPIKNALKQISLLRRLSRKESKSNE